MVCRSRARDLQDIRDQPLESRAATRHTYPEAATSCSLLPVPVLYSPSKIPQPHPVAKCLGLGCHDLRIALRNEVGISESSREVPLRVFHGGQESRRQNPVLAPLSYTSIDASTCGRRIKSEDRIYIQSIYV